jgi:HEAT repeat protein
LKSPAQDLTFGRATGTVTAPDLSRASVATAGSHLGPPHNPSALDRLEALQRVNSSGAVSDHADAVYSACNDPDPSVRAVGISLLAQIPGAATIRLLRQALNDRDPRVQANAIEVLDAIGFAERVHWIADKMKSADSRVRANAIRSCLRAEMYQAAEALLAMIESESSAHRVSALWLVEKLRLRTLLPRVQEIMEKDPDPRVRGRAKRICLRLAGQSQSAPVVHAEGSGESHGGLARQ